MINGGRTADAAAGGGGEAAARSPRVGVVVAVRDGQDHLAAALDSVLAQTSSDWCCVVVDDGSLDGTADVARTYTRDARFTLVHHTGAGAGAARNRGMQELPASVEHLAFMDGDDTWLPDALERLAGVLDADPSAVGVYGTAEYMDVAGTPVLPGAHPARQRDRRRVRGLDLAAVPAAQPRTPYSTLVVVGPIWPAAVVLVRRGVVELVGGFDEALRQCEDWDLYLRCSRHGDFVFHDEQVAWYRRHGTNTTADGASSEHYQDVVRRQARTAAGSTRAQRWTAERAWRAVQHRRVARSASRAVAAARHRDLTRVRSSLRQLGQEVGDLAAPRDRLRDGPSPAGTRDGAVDPVVDALVEGRRPAP